MRLASQHKVTSPIGVVSDLIQIYNRLDGMPVLWFFRLSGTASVIISITNSIKALDKIQTNPYAYDLVISDQTMPGLTGIELSKEIMEIRKDIPIILCTGYSKNIDKKIKEINGTIELCRKPLSKIEMANAIRSVLDK